MSNSITPKSQELLDQIMNFQQWEPLLESRSSHVGSHQNGLADVFRRWVKAKSRAFTSIIVYQQSKSYASDKLKNNPPSFMAAYLARHGKHYAVFKRSKKYQKCV